jgi:hypothetical protein
MEYIPATSLLAREHEALKAMGKICGADAMRQKSIVPRLPEEEDLAFTAFCGHEDKDRAGAIREFAAGLTK